MTTWKEFKQQAPDFAAFGEERLKGKVAYLGTVRPDGGPRVHPVTPIIGEQLFLFMEPTSPKGKDLQRDPRYTLHCAMSDSSGSSGEFYVRGQAALVTDPTVREQAVQASSYKPADRYVAFVFSVEFAFMNTYDDNGTHPRRWEAPE
jgi:hypothetical protein